MRLLYAFHGDDWGSVQRAKILIPLLRDEFTVEILQYGRADNLHFNEIVRFQVAKRNYGQFFGKFGAVLSIPTYEYAVVVTDNEPNSAWLALIHATPCIQLKTPMTKLYRQDSNILERGWMRIKKEHYCPANEQIDLKLSLDVTSEKKILKTLTAECFQHEKQNHYTVYLPEYDDKSILQVLFQFDVEWQVFTSSIYSYRIQNVWFRPFDAHSFETSIETALGVLTELNFQVCLTVLALKSKLLIIPNKHQKKELDFLENIKSLKIPVLDSLDLVHFRSIRNWLESDCINDIELVNMKHEIVAQINMFVSQYKKALPKSQPVLKLKLSKLFW